jgi:hypothetical protein
VLALVLVHGIAAAQIPIPEANRADLAEAPPRPGPGDVEERARRCFDAIVRDDPSLATDFFLPREVFRAVKGIADPDTLYDRLVRAYEEDVHELHAALGEGGASAEFVRFEFSRRRGWVRVREESNRLPYWAQRHNAIVYRASGEERRFEVRTMIAWGDRWYVTHLSEFR